jgi:hypothetical protein
MDPYGLPEDSAKPDNAEKPNAPGKPAGVTMDGYGIVKSE